MSNPNANSAPSRPRRKRKNNSLLVLAAGIFIFGAAAATLYYLLQPTTLRIAVGPPGSDDQKLIQLMAQTFARDHSSVRLSLVSTPGAVESIALFNTGKADLAVARGDLNLPANAESVAILRKNVVVLWAPSGIAPKGSKKTPVAKIKSLDELAGHRVGVVGRTEANVKLLRTILTEAGIKVDKVTITQFGVNQLAEMARDQTVDAFMTVGPLNSKITVDAINATVAVRGEPKFLPIDVSETISKKHPVYEAEEIPGSIFASSPARPEDKIDTVSVNHLIIAPKLLSDTAVGALARQIFTHRQQLARELPSASQIEKPDTDKDAALPAHTGAAAYIDGNERTFLERNSDYLWFAVMVFSGIGSAWAWLQHYWKREERAQYAGHRDNLLDLISKARTAETPEELFEMQGTADALLREALDCHEDGAIEDGELAAIGLALEQFHHAVTDRRATIAAMAPDAQRLRALQA
ncbi:TAXI family TRAP transporter solute-binding subunit [Bradyrhizobium sp. OAE829]|uniref:TAXI family TRAP transporter solute-binding subunit n=1 Tax=Bradyrhizobium sp. OAE829 TaxID=2663807 RepID=UPI001789DB8A